MLIDFHISLCFVNNFCAEIRKKSNVSKVRLSFHLSESVRKSWRSAFEYSLTQGKKNKWKNQMKQDRSKTRERQRDALSGHSIICRGELPPLSLLNAGRTFVRSILSLTGDAIGAYLARQVATMALWHPHARDAAEREDGIGQNSALFIPRARRTTSDALTQINLTRAVRVALSCICNAWNIPIANTF